MHAHKCTHRWDVSSQAFFEFIDGRFSLNPSANPPSHTGKTSPLLHLTARKNVMPGTFLCNVLKINFGSRKTNFNLTDSPQTEAFIPVESRYIVYLGFGCKDPSLKLSLNWKFQSLKIVFTPDLNHLWLQKDIFYSGSGPLTSVIMRSGNNIS